MATLPPPDDAASGGLIHTTNDSPPPRSGQGLLPTCPPETEPLVSVITPTFNRPEYLPEAIASVVAQSLQQWEMLVINDGGQDVGSIVRSFHDRRIRYLNHSVNSGKAACLNVALEQARGRYIAYLDDDDRWYPTHLAELAGELDRRPEIGGVYSDLYCVRFIRSPKDDRRIPVHKHLQVSRDFNRSFMMVTNHVLHVSLMHRRELALAVGGYDPTVRIFIDWNIARKMSLVTDFAHIPKVTGEYFVPLTGSDRISNRGREDSERFKGNLRRIKADLPPEPWVHFEPVAIILPVNDWSSSRIQWIGELFDNLCHPFRLVLINLEPSLSAERCRDRLGDLGTLGNVNVLSPRRPPADQLGAYRWGARQIRARILYLATERMQTNVLFRLIEGVAQLRRRCCDGIKWDIPEERQTSFDLLIERKRFLRLSDPRRPTPGADVHIIPLMVPAAFESDWELMGCDQALERNDPQTALQHIEKAMASKGGGASEPFFMDRFVRANLALKRYHEVIEKAGALIDAGNYGADNWLHLAQALQALGRHAQALEAFRKGFAEIGLRVQDLGEKPFPIMAPVDFGAFTALMGMGECLVALDRLPEAASILKQAARMKANSPRPALAFARLFLKAGDPARAADALDTARLQSLPNEDIEGLQRAVDTALRHRAA